MKCYKHFPDKSRKSVSTGDVWKQYLVFARPLTSVLRSSLKSKEPIEVTFRVESIDKFELSSFSGKHPLRKRE